MKKILLVDDDASFREVMQFNLAEEGYETLLATNGEEALQYFQRNPVPVVVTDLKMPKMSGLELLKALKKIVPDTNIIVITAFGDIDNAVEAMKEGAFDFIPKPCDRDHFKLMVKRAWENASLKQQVKDLQSRLRSMDKALIFSSTRMEKVITLADKVAETEATVLISGESGTGKELIAGRIHKMSPRKDKPFIAVNCAAMPRELLESELFGHVKGAFTGAVKDRKGKFVQAHGGTVFLDEIGDLPLEMQTRLLRVLQERTIDVLGKDEPIEVDIRIIAATNQNLSKAVKEGTFREDLFFRLNVFPVTIPPLRERVDDIPVLVEHFISKYGGERNFSISLRTMKRMEAYSWPGNVRELENVCQRLVLMAESDVDEDLFPTSLKSEDDNETRILSTTKIELPLEGISLFELERNIIIRALEINNYNQSSTAKYLKIPRHKLLYRLEKFNITTH